MHAVIDNYFRKILGWLVTDSIDPMSTCRLLQQAAEYLGHCSALGVVCDSGTENFNCEVDELLSELRWKRIKALVDATYSNSKTEGWWQRSRSRRSSREKHVDPLSVAPLSVTGFPLNELKSGRCNVAVGPDGFAHAEPGLLHVLLHTLSPPVQHGNIVPLSERTIQDCELANTEQVTSGRWR